MKKPNTLVIILVLMMGIFAFASCKKKEGVDMKLVLKTSQKDMLVSMAGTYSDSTFVAAIKLTDSINAIDTNGAYIDQFAAIWKQKFTQSKLTMYFFIALQDTLSQTASNDEVIEVVKAKYKSAVGKTAKVLKSRLEDYDLYDYDVALSDTLGLINLQLEGVKDTGRIMHLITACGNLEFWETFEYADLQENFNKVDGMLKIIFTPRASRKSNDSTTTDTAVPDTSAVEKEKASDPQQKYFYEHPLFAKMEMAVVKDEKGRMTAAKGPVVGYCKIKDTARINYMLRFPSVKKLLPLDLKLAWTQRPDDKNKDKLALVALKMQRDGSATIKGTVIVDASCEIEENKMPQVNMEMNEEGTNLWSRVTANNIGRCIAIVLDGYVYTYPTVQSEIPNGNSSITGNFTKEEAENLAMIIKSGMMPLHVTVVKCSTVAVPE